MDSDRLAAIDAAIDCFCLEWPQAKYGPGHIVLDDYNREYEHIQWCRGLIVGLLRHRGLDVPALPDEELGIIDAGPFDQPPLYQGTTTDEMIATLRFLRALGAKL